MRTVCGQCGKRIDGEGMAFCPYCGAKLDAVNEAPGDAEAEKWIRRAAEATAYPKKKEILLKGLEACPDSREIQWELLFIGREPAKRTRTMDFSIIKSSVLGMYHKPGDYNEEKKDSMRAELFSAPELLRCLERFEDPEQKHREYLFRLCSEYQEIFLEGSSEVMGGIFGIRFDRNRERRLAQPVAEMIARMKADEKLLPGQREQLWKTMYQAYSVRAGGKTGWLDELMVNSEK